MFQASNNWSDYCLRTISHLYLCPDLCKIYEVFSMQIQREKTIKSDLLLPDFIHPFRKHNTWVIIIPSCVRSYLMSVFTIRLEGIRIVHSSSNMMPSHGRHKIHICLLNE